jgi:hypothetical protein
MGDKMENCHDCDNLRTHAVIGTNTIHGVGVCLAQNRKKVWRCEDNNGCKDHRTSHNSESAEITA